MRERKNIENGDGEGKGQERKKIAIGEKMGEKGKKKNGKWGEKVGMVGVMIKIERVLRKDKGG